ncbi:MAG: hypothetical protein NC336_01845 [Clostridium sp.]|nr:hypothetical protein [Clostridium sp.]
MNKGQNTTTLTADAGATKTDWLLRRADGTTHRFQTPGINAATTPVDTIREYIAEASIKTCSDTPGQVDFFGAGCAGPNISRISAVLREYFPGAEITVESDMVCAARSLFGENSGVACILGTGSNSALWNGCRIVANTPPLGWILGDEGSGAYIVRRFLGDLFKGLLPTAAAERFIAATGVDIPATIEAVYSRPGGNGWLASLLPAVATLRDIPEIEAFLRDCFDNFVRRNLLDYPGVSELPVGAVGAVAWHFRDLFAVTLRDAGLRPGPILLAPLDRYETFGNYEK